MAIDRYKSLSRTSQIWYPSTNHSTTPSKISVFTLHHKSLFLHLQNAILLPFSGSPRPPGRRSSDPGHQRLSPARCYSFSRHNHRTNPTAAFPRRSRRRAVHALEALENRPRTQQKLQLSRDQQLRRDRLHLRPAASGVYPGSPVCQRWPTDRRPKLPAYFWQWREFALPLRSEHHGISPGSRRPGLRVQRSECEDPA